MAIESRDYMRSPSWQRRQREWEEEGRRLAAGLPVTSHPLGRRGTSVRALILVGIACFWLGAIAEAAAWIASVDAWVSALIS